MKIYLVRHGVAVPAGLTDAGIKQIKEASDFLKGLNLKISKTRIISSGLTRATSSAKIIQEKLGLSEVEVVPWLMCDTKIDVMEQIIDYFCKNLDCENLIAVGHQPEIEDATKNFASYFWTSFEADPRNGSIHLIDSDLQIVSNIFNPDYL